MAVELVMKNDDLVRAKCRIKTLIGDDDSSSIAALRRLSPYAIVKWSDFNHVSKTFNSKLYDMKLNATLREYFSKVFTISVKKNQGDELKVKAALENIIPHTFGEHENCGSFCTLEDDGTHKYKYFKDGKCLTDLNLRERLEKIIQPFIKSAPQKARCVKRMNPSITQLYQSIQNQYFMVVQSLIVSEYLLLYAKKILGILSLLIYINN